MEYPSDQIEEIKQLCDSVLFAKEGEINYLLLNGLNLLEGSKPLKVDALFCPVPRDGYNSRLFFSEKIDSPDYNQLNWNVNGIRILERNWYGYSWKIIETDLRLVQSVINHLRARKI